jgi:serine/threonine-protein kinase
MPLARELAQRALEIDPELPEAHAMLGIVAGHYEYDWSEAERRFRLAVNREPLSPHLRQWYGTFFLYATGRADAARLHLSRVIDEDPLCQMWRLMRANLLSSVGLEHEALDDARKAVELDPGFWLARTPRQLIYTQHTDRLAIPISNTNRSLRRGEQIDHSAATDAAYDTTVSTGTDRLLRLFLEDHIDESDSAH